MIRPANPGPHGSLTATQPGKLWVRAAVLQLALAGFAFGSADSAHAEPPASTSAPTWTGFYLGGNVGCGWADVKNDWNFFAPTVSGVTDCSPTTTAADRTRCAQAGAMRIYREL